MRHGSVESLYWRCTVVPLRRMRHASLCNAGKVSQVACGQRRQNAPPRCQEIDVTANYLRDIQAKAELTRVNRELKRLKRQIAALEVQKSKLIAASS
jgi:hypothetical protein